MKFSGLTVFCLILGTFSLSLDRSKRQADLTENATLPSEDIARRYAGAYPDSDFTMHSTEAIIQAPDAAENHKEKHLSHADQEAVHSSFSEGDPQQNYNSEVEQPEFSAITTMRPQPPPSYFARFMTRRNAEMEYNAEEDNESPYCTERIPEKINDDENTKVHDRESENVTENSLNDVDAHEATTDIPEYKYIQERSLDDTEVESSGQDTDIPTRFHLDLESMLTNKTKSKRETPSETPLYQNTIEEVQTSLPQLDVDNSNQQLDEYDYEELVNDAEQPSYLVRLLYGLSYAYSVIRGGTSSVSKMVTEFFN